MLDAVVIGSGPNGLAAAIALAREGRSVQVLEAKGAPGGGARSAELTLPGFVHDVCSTVHPLAKASPFFRQLGLEEHGLAWCESAAPLAHIVDEERVVTLERSVAATAEQLGSDGPRYRALMQPFVDHFDELMDDLLGPLRMPRHPVRFARFGLSALRSQNGLNRRFREPATRALLAGMAAHAMLPLGSWGTASFALVLGLAGHAVGWPVVQGGTRELTRALVAKLRALGGELRVDCEVRSVADLPAARVYLFDTTPRQLLRIAPAWLSPSYRRRLERYRYGPGIFKLDWALSEPIPWRDERCRRATTVHLAGTAEQIDLAETAPQEGHIAAEPFVLVAQPTLVDRMRAPAGRHVGWAYIHVPLGSTEDVSELVERRIERFAPGFREVILGRDVRHTGDLETYNANYVGGDINGGSARFSQLLFRPVVRLDPYRTSNPKVLLCSSSTPPGGGVHGLCGFWAARSALRLLG